MSHRKLGVILVEQNAISRAQLRLGQQGAKDSRQRLGHWLVRKGWITYSDIAKALAEQSGRSYVPPELLQPDLLRLNQYAPGALECLNALPIVDEECLTVAVPDPGDLDLVGEIQRIVGERVRIVVSDEDVIHDALQGRYHNKPLYKGSPADKRVDRRILNTDPMDCDIAFFTAASQALFGGDVLPGCLMDVSQGGGRLLGALAEVIGRERVLEPGVHAWCTIDCPGVSTQPFTLKGSVRWMREVDGNSAEIGISWLPREGTETAYLRVLLIKLHQLEAGAIRGAREDPDTVEHLNTRTAWRILQARRRWRPE